MPKRSERAARRDGRGGINDRGLAPFILGAGAGAVFFGGLAVWSATAPLESAAVAPAVVRMQEDRRTLDHPDGGVIDRILIGEGDVVAAGDVLLTLDTAMLRSSIEVMRRRDDTLRALQARLLAEQDQADAVAYPEDLRARAADEPELAAALAAQDAHFAAMRAAVEGEAALRQQSVRPMNRRLDGLRAKLEATQAQLELIGQEREDLERLFSQGLTQQGRVMALRRETARLEGEIGDHLAEIGRVEATIVGAELEIAQMRRTRLSEISEELREGLAEIHELAPKIAAAETQLARAALRAPASGAVIELRKFTEGGVLRPGEPILDIVPGGASHVVEARIAPATRDMVETGMSARIRVSAASHRDSEPAPGVIRRISADAIEDPQTRERYYAAMIEVDAAFLETRGLTLEPGMSAEVIVPLKARTALAYLFEPLLKSWSRALREI